MATEFQMPKLGLTMESGTILQWLVDDMSEVTAGDIVMLIETDKVESEIGCSESGILKQLGQVGETYDCQEVIGWYLEPGEEPPAAPTPAAAPAFGGSAAAAPAQAAAPAPVAVTRGDGGRILASPNAKRVAKELGVDIAHVAGTGPGGRITSEDVEEAARNPRPVAPAATAPVGPGGVVAATFAARQLADMLGVDLAQVPISGVDPRVTKDDVAAYVRAIVAAYTGSGAPADTALPGPAAAPAPAAAPLLQEPTTVVPLKGMRGVIAERMHGSLQQMAQLTLNMDVDMGAVIADREARKANGAAPGFTDYVIAASAKALADHPYVNSQVTDDGVAHLPEIHVGMAVALDEGLMVPVVKDTLGLDLDALSSETTRLADATRGGKLQLAEMEGGTFSVTALGMFGVDGFTPVINPPNTAILGVGRLRDETVWEGDTPTRRTMLTLSLTWDHRAFDGAPAAEFAQTIKRYLESGDLS